MYRYALFWPRSTVIVLIFFLFRLTGWLVLLPTIYSARATCINFYSGGTKYSSIIAAKSWSKEWEQTRTILSFCVSVMHIVVAFFFSFFFPLIIFLSTINHAQLLGVSGQRVGRPWGDAHKKNQCTIFVKRQILALCMTNSSN